MFQRLLGLLTLVLALSIPSVKAQQLTPQLRLDLQRELDRVTGHFGVKGAVAAVRLPDGSLWSGATGMSTDSPAVALRPDMLFSVASVTKTFTAAMTMRLAQRSWISLDDSIGPLLPPYARLPNINPNLTIRQLLAHTDGLGDYTANNAFWNSIWATPSTLITKQQLVGWVGPPLNPPNAVYEYGNTGYLLLGLIIERRMFKPFSLALRQELWGPAGMNHTYLGAYDSIPPTEEEAHAWTLRGGQMEDLTPGTRRALLSGFFSAGGAMTRVEDLALWGKALFGSRTIMAPQTLQIMQQLTSQSIAANVPSGLGCTVIEMGNQDGWGHPGNIPGTLSIFAYEPRCDVSVALIFNDDRIGSLRRAIIERLYNVVQQAVCPQLLGNIWEASRKEPLRFSPNPTSGYALLNYGMLPGAQAELELWDATGRMVRKIPLVPGHAMHEIPLQDIPAGVYCAQVREISTHNITRVSGRLVVE